MTEAIRGLVVDALGGPAEDLPPGVCDVCFNFDPANDPCCEIGQTDLARPAENGTARASVSSCRLLDLQNRARNGCFYCTSLMQGLDDLSPEAKTAECHVVLYLGENIPLLVAVYANEHQSQAYAEAQTVVEFYLEELSGGRRIQLRLRDEHLDLRKRLGQFL